MARLLKVTIGTVVVVALLLVVLWVVGPFGGPVRSLMQQLSVLPEWLAPGGITASQAEAQIRAADGYGVSLFATDVFDARGLRVTSAGDVLVSVPRDGEVLLLQADADGDGRADGRRVLVSGLRRPYGLDFHDGFLYVGEEDGIGRIRFAQATGQVSGEYQRVVEDLPVGGNHWRNPIRFGPDDLLYVTIGSSCNVCMEADVRRGTMLRFTPDGAFVDIYASGLRNAVGFDWAADGTLYATENGRDLLGDDFPPCELNEIVAGGFYGWPFANGARIPDPDFGDQRDAEIDASIPPAHEFRAHNAPLGIVFLDSDSHTDDYRGAAIVALHGSWNRSEPDGYKVVSLHFGADGTIVERDFLWGFLVDGDVVGRPAEVAEAADGTIYVSDDYGGAVYRVRPGDGTVAGVGAARTSTGYEPERLTEAERRAASIAGAELMANGGCVECHIPHALPADAPVALKVLDDLGSRYTIEELTAYLAIPNPPMPPFVGTDAERRALAIYLLETY